MKLKNNLFACFCLFLTCNTPTLTIADEFLDYVASCKAELDISEIPQFDCRAERFRAEESNRTFVNYGTFKTRDFTATNDFVAHKQINADVDAVYACRWVSGNPAVSKTGEMIVHNRRKGTTCFFEQKVFLDNQELGSANVLGSGLTDTTQGFTKTTNPPSPTDKNGKLFWNAAIDKSGKGTLCTSCHSAGPYIASQEIVGALAKFGLINDGHDIQGAKYIAVDNSTTNILNTTILTTLQPSTSSLNLCAKSCHLVGGYGNSGDFIQGINNISESIIIPSINLIIEDLVNLNKMPPEKNSDYFSINRDTPYGTGSSETGDHEHLSEARRAFPNLDICVNPTTNQSSDPTSVEAHTVDSSIILKANANGIMAGKKLSKFNLYDGVVCKDSDNPAVMYSGCWNWQTRYKCGDEWTDWLDGDAVSDGVENETRANYEKAYKALHVNDGKTFCSNPTHIQARYRLPTTSVQYSDPKYGPRDRLRQFDNSGLRCYNEDQPNKQCHNYVVKFICP